MSPRHALSVLLAALALSLPAAFPVQAAPPPPVSAPQDADEQDSPIVEQVMVRGRDGHIAVGDRVRVFVSGTGGCNATVEAGRGQRVPMEEMHPGRYEASLTVPGGANDWLKVRVRLSSNGMTTTKSVRVALEGTPSRTAGQDDPDDDLAVDAGPPSSPNPPRNGPPDARNRPSDDDDVPPPGDRNVPPPDDRNGPPRDDRNGPGPRDDRNGPPSDDRDGPGPRDDRNGPPSDDRDGPPPNAQDDPEGDPYDAPRNGPQNGPSPQTYPPSDGQPGEVFIKVFSPAMGQWVGDDFAVTGRTLPFAQVEVTARLHQSLIGTLSIGTQRQKATAMADAKGRFSIPLHLSAGGNNVIIRVVAMNPRNATSRVAEFTVGRRGH